MRSTTTERLEMCRRAHTAKALVWPELDTEPKPAAQIKEAAAE